MSNPETVTIPIAEYLNLVARDLFLSKLEEAGVDNWEWYHLAFQEEEEEEEEEEGEPLSLEDWCYEVNIERQYEQFYDEYGDGACCLFDFKKYHYEEYLESFKKK